MQFARKVGIAIEKTLVCNRVGMSVIGLEVPHVHVHLIPLHTMSDALMKYETIDSKQIDQIMDGKIPSPPESWSDDDSSDSSGGESKSPKASPAENPAS